MDWNEQQRLARIAAMEAERMRRFAKVPNIAPVDPFDTAGKCGCAVRYMSLPSLEGMYSPEPQPIIVVGSQRPAGRRAYTCAHELGHHVFGHGVMLEELNSMLSTYAKSPEEFLADTFAGFFLMSQMSVLRAVNDRGWSRSTLTPVQTYALACYFGVGYGAIVNHLCYSLRFINQEHANALLKIKPKEIKGIYGAMADTEVILVDCQWRHRTIDVEVGDTIILPEGVIIDAGAQLLCDGEASGQQIVRAIAPGLARVAQAIGQWAAHIRIARKDYEGLSEYRFLEEAEGE